MSAAPPTSAPEPRRTPPSWLRALGENNLPPRFELDGRAYTHVQTFKHDFFAATGLYEGADGRVVLKVGRMVPVLGFPMRWIGRRLMLHESRLYELFQDLDGVPRFVGRVPPTGLAHEYIEGAPLSNGVPVDDDFFPSLKALVRRVHDRGAAYVDLNKPQNVLVEATGRPYLIDFQISFHVPWPVLRRLTWPVLWILQRSDEYHVLKHMRRFRPDQLTEAERRRVESPPIQIRLHRLIGRPIIYARRLLLVWLGARTPGKQSEETGTQT